MEWLAAAGPYQRKIVAVGAGKMRAIRPGMTVLLLSTLHGGYSAAQEDDLDVALTLEPVIVEATRLGTEIDRVPAAISVVGRDDVQLGRQQLGLDESLVAIPGLFLQNRYNFAQDLRISIRGFGARAGFGIRGVRVFVDGIPETLPDGQAGVDSIDLGSVERIEVLRGPAASMYGNASGGVINIISERGPEIPFVETRLSAGELGFSKYQLKFGGDTGRLNYMVNASHMEYDGYRVQSATRNTQFNGNFRYQIDDSSELAISAHFTDQPRADDPGALTRDEMAENPRGANPAALTFDAGEDLDQQRIGLVYKKSFGELHELQLRNYYVWRDFLNRLPFVAGGSVVIDRFFSGGGASYTYLGEILGQANRLMVGVDYDRQDDDRSRFNNDFGVQGDLTFEQNEKVTNRGVFVQNELTLTDQFVLTLGLRHDRIEIDVTDRFLDDGDDSGRRTFSETSPMFGLLYALSPAANLYATIATAFETPTTTELANPSGAGGFNPGIEPQQATNYEIGVKGRVDGRTHYQLALFTTDVEDELVPFQVEGQPGRTFFANAGESRRRGVELGLLTRPFEGLQLTMAYTWSDFEFREFVDAQGNDFAGNVIPGGPEHQVYGEISYARPSGFYASLDLLRVGSLYLNNANTERSSSYTVSNLRAGYELQNGPWSISPFLGVNNVFDENYPANVRINAFGGRFFEPAPERNAYAGVSFGYRFGGSP
jgi:iron complex outermembrane recepter protein